MTRSEAVRTIIPLTDSAFSAKITPFTPLAGRPIIEYVLQAAEACERVASVRLFAQTDAIVHTVRSYGLEAAVVSESHGDGFWEWVARCTHGNGDSTVVALSPLCPLLLPATIDAALDQFDGGAPRPIVALERLVDDHPFKLRHMDNEGRCVPLLFGSMYYDENTGIVIHGKTGKQTCFRQNLPGVYQAGPAFTVFRASDASRVGRSIQAGETGWVECDGAHEVDSLLAWLRAQIKLGQQASS